MATNTQLNTGTVPISVITTTVTLSSANILGMSATGIVLIAAQGAHTYIMVHDVFMEYIFNTTTYSDGDVMQLQYGITEADLNANPIFTVGTIVLNAASSFYATNGSDGGGGGVYLVGVVNQGVYISNYTQPFTGGNSTLKITLVYSVITTTS